jgi:26S proteasome regulatory subunit N1
MAGLLIMTTLMTNVDEFLIKNNHYMLSYLGLSFNPKYLFVLDQDLKEMGINLRVGQALDTVG